MSLKYFTIPVTLFQQNCSIIWCDESQHAAIIDPGGEAAKIQEKVNELGLHIKYVLLTHGHLDHVGNSLEVAKYFSCPVWGPHEADSFWLNMLVAQSEMMRMPLTQPFTPDQWLVDNQTIPLGQCTLEVIHTPGHTPGHVVFFEKAAQIAFVGDVLFHGSIGRTDFPQGDMETLVTSIKTKLWPLGNDVRFVPGHGPESTFGHERQHNQFVADQQ